METDPARDPKSPGPPSIPTEVELWVLDILDATEPGEERQQALAEVHAKHPELEEEVRRLVKAAEDEPAPSPLPSPSASLPRRFGEYELLEILGRGAMGIVYLARDRRLGRQVALKILPEHFADDPRRLQRFEREIRAVATLKHPRIVQVFEAGEVDSVPYFAMEYVEGTALDKIIDTLAGKGRPPGQLGYGDLLVAIGGPKRKGSSTTSGPDTRSHERTYMAGVCHLVIDAAEALQHAHEHGIIHRDVKTSNIMVRSDGRSLLFDFGLARMQAEPRVTLSGEVMGTPHYMSPEQVAGDREGVGHRSDIYSLGVTLYELLTLQVPFPDVSQEKIYQMILHREPASPRQANPMVPRDLETICEVAMEKKPARRFQTAGEMAEQLRKFLRYEPLDVRPTSALTRSMRWVHRNRAPVAIVLLLQIGLIVVVYLLLVMSALTSVEKDLEDKTGDLKIVSGQLTDKNTQLDHISETLKQSTTEHKRLQQTLDETKGQVDGLSSERDALFRENIKAQKELGTIKTQRDEIQEQLDEAQTNLEDAQQKTGVAKADLDKASKGKEKAERSLKDIEDKFGDLKTSHRQTVVNRLLMEALDRIETDPGFGLMLASAAAKQAAWLRTGGSLAQLREKVDSTLLKLLHKSHERRTFLGHGHESTVTAVDLSPDGKKAATASVDGTVHVWDSASGKIVRSMRDEDISPVHLEFSPRTDNQALLIAGDGGELLFWNLAGPRGPRRLLGARHHATVLRHFSPDGKHIVSHLEGRPRTLKIWPASAAEAASWTLDDPQGTIVSFDFDPRGEKIVISSLGQRVKVCSLTPGEFLRSFRLLAPPLWAAFDQSGERIATLDASGLVSVYSVVTGSRLRHGLVNNGNPLGTGRIAFCNEDRNLLVSATGAAAHYVLQTDSLQILHEVPVQGQSHIFFHPGPKGCLVAYPGPRGSFQLYNVRSGKRVASLRGHVGSLSLRHRPLAIFDREGLSLATVNGDSTARIWNTGPGGALPCLSLWMAERPARIAQTDRLILARFGPRADRIFLVSHNELGLWDLRTRTCLLSVPSSNHLVGTALFNRNGMTALALHNSRIQVLESSRPKPTVSLHQRFDKKSIQIQQAFFIDAATIGVTLQKRELSTTRELRLFDSTGKATRSLYLPPGIAGGGPPLVGPKGERLVIGYDELTVVSLDRARSEIRLPNSQRPAAFTGDGGRLASSTGFSVKIWDLPSGNALVELQDLPSDQSTLSDLAFSPDDSELASAWSDGSIRIHDARTGHRILHEQAHALAVRTIRYGLDAGLLVSSSEDGSTRVWWHRGSKLQLRLAFSPEERCLHAEFTSAGDQVLVTTPIAIHLFPLLPQKLAAANCPRQLSQEERTDYGIRPLTAR